MNKEEYTFTPNQQDLIINSINSKGFAVAENLYKDTILLSKLEDYLIKCVKLEAKYHGTVNYKDYAMLLACPIYGGPFIEVLENGDFWKPFNTLLGESCIAYVYTSSSMPPKKGNYSTRIHVDRPFFNPKILETLGSLICINDFNKNNGSTWVLPYSHLSEKVPDENYFYKNAFQIEANRGSVLYFNLRLWHAGGKNFTSKWRHSLGIGMIKPYFKQRIDLPRAISKEVEADMPIKVKQKLGYFAQVPSSLDEYYAPIEDRKYKEKSEWED